MPQLVPTPAGVSPQTLAELDALVVEGARFVAGPGGSPHLEVRTPRCTAELAVQGAQVLRWAPAGAQPVLYVSPRCVFAPGKGMRGGIPVCFPWFADRTGDPRPGGTASPNHGFVRTKPWQVEAVVRDSADVVRVLLATTDDAASHALWPHAFEARLEVAFGAELAVTLEVTNTGTGELRYEEALHSYFAVSDVARTRIEGLEAGPYIDKVDARTRKEWDGRPLTFAGETDAVFLDRRGAVRIVDEGLGRTLEVAKRGSRTTVVWNPGAALAEKMADIGVDAWQGFVCVESANALPHAVVLPPGTRHTLTQRISVTPITSETNETTR